MSNLQRLRKRLEEKGVGAAMISNMDNVRWVTGFTGSSGLVVVDGNDGVFITDSRYDQQAREQVPDLDVYIYSNPQTMAQAAVEFAKKLGAGSVAFESEHVSFASFKNFEKEFNGIALEPVEGLAGPLRMVKTAEEIEKMKRACALADACYSHVVRMIQVGVTEYDVALDIEFYFRRNKAELAFAPIVVSGERSARPHGIPSEKKLEKGDFVTMDFGAKLDGYCSDLTRTVVVGEASDRHKEVYEAVLTAQMAAIAGIKPGIEAKEVDAIARNILAEKDLAQYFGHGLGHGLGSVVHDVGRMGPTSTDIVEVGQVWTMEPGVYIPDFGGVRIEDDVVVTEDGCELLTHSPKHLQVV
jgi:Xaa-Pro aminopeptidase